MDDAFLPAGDVAVDDRSLPIDVDREADEGLTVHQVVVCIEVLDAALHDRQGPLPDRFRPALRGQARETLGIVHERSVSAAALEKLQEEVPRRHLPAAADEAGLGEDVTDGIVLKRIDLPGEREDRL